MSNNTPDVGFNFGVEGDKSLLGTIQQLRNELKLLKASHDDVKSSAIDLAGAWHSLVAVAASLELAKFGKEAFDSVVAVGRLSAATGISTQTLSAFRKATQDMGIEQGRADQAVLRLSKSLFSMEQGNKKLAGTFALLKDSAGKALTPESFKGLTDDQKFLRIADALGHVQGSMEAAGAATQLLGKGSGELLGVFKRMTEEAFPELVKETRELGLQVTPQMVKSFLRAQQSLEDLEGVAVGAAMQFETGLIPQLSLAADGILNVVAKTDAGKSGFEQMGEIAGNRLKEVIALLSLVGIWAKAVGLTILEAIGGAFEEMGIVANTAVEATFQALNLRFSKAWQAIKDGNRDAGKVTGDVWENAKKRIDAALDSQNKLLEGLMGGRTHPTPPKGRDLDLERAAAGALGKERLSALKQQSQDELALDRILARGREQVEKDSYERGLLSLTEYFNRRRDAIRVAADEETDVLRRERSGLGKELVAVQGRPLTAKYDDKVICTKNSRCKSNSRISKGTASKRTKLQQNFASCNSPKSCSSSVIRRRKLTPCSPNFAPPKAPRQ